MKEKIFNLIIATTLGLLSVSLIASALNDIYVNHKFLGVLEKYETLSFQKQYPEASLVLSYIDTIFNKTK